MSNGYLTRAILEQLAAGLSAKVPADRGMPFAVVARQNLFIKNEHEAVVPFRLRRVQKLYLAMKRLSVMKGRPRRYLVLKHRRVGITTLEQGISYWVSSRRRNTTVLTMAYDIDVTQRTFEIARMMHERDPGAPRIKGPGNQKRLEFEALNSLFYMRTAGSKKSGRGDTLSRVHWSEVAWSMMGPYQVPMQRALLAGITEAAKHGEIVLETTPNGSELFKELWDKAKRGENEWTPIFLPWFADEDNRVDVVDDEAEHIMGSLSDVEALLVEQHDLDAGQIKWRRKKAMELGPLLAQEYPDNDVKCFLSSGLCYFDVDAMVAHQARVGDLVSRGMGELAEPPGARHVPGGYEVEWEPPVVGEEYVIGHDSSEGIPGCDPCGWGVMKKSSGAQVAAGHGYWSPKEQAGHLARVHKRYNGALIGVERENHGHAVLLELGNLGLGMSHHRGGPLYHFQKEDRSKQGRERAYERAGWSTNSVTRPVMISDLSQWSSDPGAEDRVRDPLFVVEALSFRRQKDGKWAADPGAHDDAVMKWAVAVQMRNVPIPKPGAAWV